MSNPVLSGAPAPGPSCRVCGGALTESLRCRQCGAAFGEANRCPHCRSVTDVEPHDALRQRCRVCGGARVPLDDPKIVRSGREIPVLARAQRAHVRRALWRVSAGVVGGFGLLSLAVALLVIVGVGPSLVGLLAMLGASAVPFVVAALAWASAARQARLRDAALDEAWALVAGDVLGQKGGELTADELGKLMRIDVSRAEALLAELNLRDFVHARVTEEGDLAYSVAGQKHRVDPEAKRGVEAPEQDEALERARATAEGTRGSDR